MFPNNIFLIQKKSLRKHPWNKAAMCSSQHSIWACFLKNLTHFSKISCVAEINHVLLRHNWLYQACERIQTCICIKGLMPWLQQLVRIEVPKKCVRDACWPNIDHIKICSALGLKYWPRNIPKSPLMGFLMRLLIYPIVWQKKSALVLILKYDSDWKLVKKNTQRKKTAWGVPKFEGFPLDFQTQSNT